MLTTAHNVAFAPEILNSLHICISGPVGCHIRGPEGIPGIRAAWKYCRGCNIGIAARLAIAYSRNSWPLGRFIEIRCVEEAISMSPGNYKTPYWAGSHKDARRSFNKHSQIWKDWNPGLILARGIFSWLLLIGKRLFADNYNLLLRR